MSTRVLLWLNAVTPWIVRRVENKRVYLETIGIVVVLSLVNHATLPVNLVESHDSLSYLEMIERNSSPWQFDALGNLWIII